MSANFQMQSTLSKDGIISLALNGGEIPTPEAHEVVIKVEASPINPSDLGVLFGPADADNCTSSGSGTDTVLQAKVPPAILPHFSGRFGMPLPVGNEGGGTVIAAGESDEAQALMGKTVGAFGGGMYAQYRCVPAMNCLPLAPDATAKDGASSFVNPMTALAMTEVMKMEDHKALIHTAAASNLGQMLNKICIADGIDLVNIVRKPEQAEILKNLGAKYICNSSDENFMESLVDAIVATGASLAFDATGGGTLASTILTAIEMAEQRKPHEYSIYGSAAPKQVYIYGGLDTGPTVLTRAFGLCWDVGGWLLPNFLAKAGMEVNVRMRTRVAKELTTTFASQYTSEISLVEALQADIAQQYNAKTTGEKYLIVPQKGL